jgi:hypothetical protein
VAIKPCGSADGLVMMNQPDIMPGKRCQLRRSMQHHLIDEPFKDGFDERRKRDKTCESLRQDAAHEEADKEVESTSYGERTSCCL